MYNRLLCQAAGPVGAALAALACWVGAGALADRQVGQELEAAVAAQRQTTHSVVEGMAEVIASDLSLSRAMPATVAQAGVVATALSEAANFAATPASTELERRAQLLREPALDTANRFLHDARGFSGFDAIWLINTNGLCVASSNARDAVSYVGADLRKRPYLGATLLGAFTETYGVGMTSGEPGMFVASPVYDNGLLVGAVVAKVSIMRLRHWVSHPGSFVSDSNGVIIMAHDTALEGFALPRAPVAQMDPTDRHHIYQRTTFREIALQSAAQSALDAAPWMPHALAAQLVALPGQRIPALYETRGGLNSGLSAHFVDPLSGWSELLANRRRDGLLIFLTLGGSTAFVAVISVSWVRERRLYRATRELAEQLQSANALLAAEARHDALTGALSRRYFLDLLRREADRAYASGATLCLAIADLDHFKQINDRFGHPVGDRALKQFVETCRAQLRTGDAIGRLGGEEFAIVLPATPLAAGREIVETLRREVKACTSRELPADVNLTVSIGVTELAREHEPLERLVARADLALYEAKAGGRDRCEARPPDGIPPRATAEPDACQHQTSRV